MIRSTTLLGAILLVSSVVWGVNTKPTEAVMLNGTVYFAQPPSLVKAITTFKEPQTPSTYYFTIDLPAQAGEPLQRLDFTQYKGLETIAFNLKSTTAEVEDSNSKQQPTIGSVTRDAKTNTISVTFNPPVPPGEVIKIGLHSVSNPLSGGVYLFGVTAFPAGEKSHGQFLGYGRLQFITPGSRF